MATAEQRELVKLNLPSWREELTPEWNDAKIESVIDTFSGNLVRVVRQFWVVRVSDTQPLTDITENGSTVNQAQNHEHAVAMLAYWDKVIASGGTLTTGAQGTSFGKIKKRYQKPGGFTMPLDPYGVSGVYARTN